MKSASRTHLVQLRKWLEIQPPGRWETIHTERGRSGARSDDGARRPALRGVAPRLRPRSAGGGAPLRPALRRPAQWRRLNPRRSCPRHAQPTNLGGLSDSELIPTLLGRQVESSTQSASAAAANAALQTLTVKQVCGLATRRPSCVSSLSYAPTRSQLCSSRVARRVADHPAGAEELTFPPNPARWRDARSNPSRPPRCP